MDFRQNYEISVDAKTYFDESSVAMERLSRDLGPLGGERCPGKLLMTPAQFLAQMQRKEIAPAYVFLGAERYQRARCRTALLDAMLSPEEREEGIARHDLGEVSLAEVIDDARALSLFASRRVLLISNAEAALPRQKGDDDEGDGESAEDGAALLAAYLKDPSPGVVLLFDAQRYEFEGDERKKLERVGKFYASHPRDG